MTARQSKVLIADDSNTVHQQICESLPADYTTNILHAFDGVECLYGLDEGVDLAFIDVHMPSMSGLDALWAARIAGNKTFVTLMSGQATRRCIDLARQLEAYEFLTKPFGSADIGAILATHRRVTKPMQVLLVDDSPVSLKVMRKVLDSSVFRLNIDDANTGAEALARCDAEPFDVVFLDVNMPGLNGYAILARLIQANPQTKVVMISGDHDALRERQAIRLGAAAIMHKPFFPTEIDAALHRIMGLQSPKLATGGYVRDFGIKIHGRTITVEHVDSGHMYEYVWFREPPYLRLPLIRENESATIPVADLTANAKKAAMLEIGECQPCAPGARRLVRHATAVQPIQEERGPAEAGPVISGKRSPLLPTQLQTRQHR
jgi:CheY-like chemotaxis protein